MNATTLTVGHGRAHGAVTVLNATASGVGCSLAIHAPTTATWQWTEAPGWSCGTGGAPGADDGLARAVARHAADALGLGDAGARVTVRAAFPPSRGLKTSSSVATALLRAAFESAGQRCDDAALERRAVACSRAAGVTLTGAFDDQVAVTRGGCHLTDNAALRIVRRVRVEPWHVAVWVPTTRIVKADVRGVAASKLRTPAAAVVRLIEDGDVPAALSENGRMFHDLYAQAGLPVTDKPTQAALAAGALGAGLSGTGPAVAALFDQPVDLPSVTGGRWSWSRVEVGA